MNKNKPINKSLFRIFLNSISSTKKSKNNNINNMTTES